MDLYTESTSYIHFFTIAICAFVVCRLKNARVRRSTWRSTPRHRQSMETGFQNTVRATANVIHQENGKPSIKDPESGVYHVDVRETAISDSKTNNLLYGGFENPSVLTIQVMVDEESDGWLVQGTRKCTGKGFYVISEGFIAPSGKAYWVETSNYQSILVSGDYSGDEFSGEWLSSNGDRGHYTYFRRVSVVQADTAILLNNEALATDDAKPPAQDPLILWV